MTHPRIVRPGQVLMTQARVVARFYLLRPDSELHRGVAYVLGHYASKHGVVLHAACLMSTHLHLVFTDPHGNYPSFLRELHRGIANLTKAFRGWRGVVFGGRPNVVRLLTLEAVVDKIGYVLANPVGSGAVRYSRDWPGLLTKPREIGGRGQLVPRPRHYFDPAGHMPSAAKLVFEMPECILRAHGPARAQERLAQSVEHHERRGRAEVERRGWKFLGHERCLRISPYRRARAYEVFGKREPTLATLGGGMAAFQHAVTDTRLFRAAYRSARRRYRDGDLEASFPYGTWFMRRVYGVRCVGPPRAPCVG